MTTRRTRSESDGPTRRPATPAAFVLAPSHEHAPLRFPPGFLWGTATSAHQAEGGDRLSDWWSWERRSGKVSGGDRSGKAVDFWRRYGEDFAAAARFGMNAHRMSIEWSRIEPREGRFDPKAIAHYRTMLRALRAAGQEPMVTLFHFTLPAWLSRQGGWASPKAVRLFERFTRKAADSFGDLVEFWCTINEPMVYPVMGRLLGMWPPGKKDAYLDAWRVFRNLAKGHVAAYEVLHQAARAAGRPVKVGAANNLISLYSYKKHSLLDAAYLAAADKVWNHAFFDLTRGSHDYLGVNYYFHQRIKRGEGKFFEVFVDIRGENREMSEIGWEIYPAGIFDVMQELKELHLPIYVTENGIATLNDDRRVRFIVSYLKELYHAIQSGIDIRGYFHWSLMDNFEWEKGYAATFGLMAVDRKTLARTPRKSFRIYGQIARANAIPHALLRYVGHGVH